MVIVAGHIVVASEHRERYLAQCSGVMEQARRAPGCLDSPSPPTCSSPGASPSSSTRWTRRPSRPSAAAA